MIQETPYQQIRGVFNKTTIRVYQAYSDPIADSALKNGTLVSPPFKIDRMTWIKPSFLWMMYRAGWGHKDDEQKRILAIDISRDGFEWALAHSCPSRPDSTIEKEDWEQLKKESPVRIQWDPERNLELQPLPYRTIQIGLSKEAVKLYINQWIMKITEVTGLAHKIRRLLQTGDINQAQRLLPKEIPYTFQSKEL